MKSQYLIISILAYIVLGCAWNLPEVSKCDCGGEIQGRSGENEIYKTVKMGTQCWMVENLNYKFPAGGNSFCLDTKPVKCDTYGRLYLSAAFEDGNEPCPRGWHVPSDAEWQILEEHLGINPEELNWGGPYSSAPSASDETRRGMGVGNSLKNDDFQAELGGWMGPSGKYQDEKESTFFWTSTKVKDISKEEWIFFRQLTIGTEIRRGARSESLKDERAYYIRCIKDCLE